MVQKSCFPIRLQVLPEPHEDALLVPCGRLLQQEAAIFSHRSPSTPPGCDVVYCRVGISKTFVIPRLSAIDLSEHHYTCTDIESSMELLFPLSMPYPHNPACIETMSLIQMAASRVWLGYRKAVMFYSCGSNSAYAFAGKA